MVERIACSNITFLCFFILGELPSANVDESEPYQPSAENAKLYNQYDHPPADLYTNDDYDERLPILHRLQDDTYAKMEKIPTIDGQKVDFVRTWLPSEASKSPNFKLMTCYLRYCPATVHNFCSDRKGGHFSPMAAMFKNGQLRSATWRLLQLIFGDDYWKMAKTDTTPIVKKYKGSVYDLYTKENYRRLMDIYNPYIEKLIELSDMNMFCSRGVLTELEYTFGKERYEALVDKLLREKKVISCAGDKIVTIYHPEAVLNIVYHRNNFEWVCDLLDEVCTLALQYYTGDMSIRCTVGSDIFNKVEGTDAFKLMQAACREALLRAQKVVKETSVLMKAGQIDHMTESQLNVLNNWTLTQIASRAGLRGELSAEDTKTVKEIVASSKKYKSLEAAVEIIRKRRVAQSTFAVSNQLAADRGNGKEIDISASAKSLDIKPEVLRKRVKTQVRVQAPAKLAADIGRNKKVDFDKEALKHNTTATWLRENTETQQHNQSTFAVSNQLAADRGNGKEIDISASAKSLDIKPEVLRKRVKTQVRVQAPAKLAAALNRDENIDIAASAKSLDIKPEDLHDRVKTQRDNQNDIVNLGRAASAANRGQEVDIKALARSRRKSESETRKSLENTQRNQNDIVNLGRAASAANRGQEVDIKALARSRRKSESETRKSLENTQRYQNDLANLGRAASAASRGQEVDIKALARSRRKSESETRKSLDNAQRAQQEFRIKKAGDREAVVAEYDDIIIGTFAMASFGKDASEYAKLYSCLARLQQFFNKKPIPGLIEATQIKKIAGGHLGGMLLGMTLRKARSTEEFTDEDFRTGFRVNEPAFERWKAANVLHKITHIKDDGSNKICEGVIYRTAYQLEQMTQKLFRCGCDRDKQCNDGKKLGKKFGVEEAIIPFGEFYREGQ